MTFTQRQNRLTSISQNVSLLLSDTWLYCVYGSNVYILLVLYSKEKSVALYLRPGEETLKWDLSLSGTSDAQHSEVNVILVAEVSH
jgi:hypothetical protein